jgi:hypothetical protein
VNNLRVDTVLKDSNMLFSKGKQMCQCSERSKIHLMMTLLLGAKHSSEGHIRV